MYHVKQLSKHTLFTYKHNQTTKTKKKLTEWQWLNAPAIFLRMSAASASSYEDLPCAASRAMRSPPLYMQHAASSVARARARARARAMGKTNTTGHHATNMEHTRNSLKDRFESDNLDKRPTIATTTTDRGSSSV